MKDLTQYENAQSVLKEYNALAKDLIGENEEVECPECGKECSGRNGLDRHISMKHEGEVREKFSSTFLSDREVYDEISEQTPYNPKTVENLVRIAQLPEELQIFVKTPGERS